MWVWRFLAAPCVVIGLAACGGSSQKPTAAPSSHPVSAVIAPSAPTVILPASSRGPTTCTVYESGFATPVIFDSESRNVSPACAAWSSRQSGAGYLWSYQPASAAQDTTAIRVCDLRDPSGRVSASVVEDAGFVPVSAAERTRSALACSSMRAEGWTVRGRS